MSGLNTRAGLFLGSFLTTGLFLVMGGFVSGVPPIARILNPYDGVWRNQPRANLEQPIFLESLKAKVVVKVDEYEIPHIFAENDHDLYVVQGYLTARDRLFLMELNARAGFGSLSELVGDSTYYLDDYFVRLGFRDTVSVDTKELLSDPLTRLAAEGFANGVNAYVAQLDSRSLPVEYKLLAATPMKWDASRAVQLLMSMTYRLAGMTSDIVASKVLRDFGGDSLDSFSPAQPANVDPIVHEKKVWNFSGLGSVGDYKSFLSVFDDFVLAANPPVSNGSNNWAVTSQKSKTGYPIVSNDTHLAYSLPPIWYEVQLHTPKHNVYGATIPGAPGVLVGFNQNISWAVTNATMDGLDFYEIELDKSGKHYRFEGEWKEITYSEHKIKMKSGDSKSLRLGKTHQGFILGKKGSKALVARWTAHEPSNELKAFLGLNRSRNFSECWSSLDAFTAPAQNFICADKKDVAIKHNGLLPKKWEGQGSVIMDGSKKINDWKAWVARDELPYLKNPSSGFVRSANQNPTNGDYPHYLGTFYDDSYRAERIRKVLEAKDKVNWQDMADLQYDTTDTLAERVLPHFLRYLDSSKLDSAQLSLLDELRKWDYVFVTSKVAPSLYSYWWKQFREKLWSDQFGDRYKKLYRSRALEVLDHPEKNGVWIDDVGTDDKETLEALVTASYLDAYGKLTEKYGKYSAESWRWGKVNRTVFPHVLKVDGLGSDSLEVGGTSTTVNANYGGHGATWRMVVELGEQPQAYTQIPGGQIGDPMDRRFESGIKEWGDGKLKKVYFLDGPSDEQARSMKTIEFSPGGD